MPYQERFIEGCVKRGYSREFAVTTFKQFKGFAHYGFPESHSASFALIAYASSYLKCYHPAAFAAALLNSQPMGFYAPHTIVEDARRHGVEVRPVDVRHSNWDCTIEEGSEGRLALRLGLRLVKGLGEKSGRRIEEARGEGYASVSDVARRSRIPRHDLARLALAGVLSGLCGGRREALWELQALGPLEEDDLFFGLPLDQTPVALPQMSVSERVCADYQGFGLSLELHPLALLRPGLDRRRALRAVDLLKVKPGRKVGVGGMVICRQRPPTAKGFCFLSLEDETGISNVVVPPALFERDRSEILGSIFLYAEGRLEKAGKVINVKAERVVKLSLQDAALDRGKSRRASFQTVPLGHR